MAFDKKLLDILACPVCKGKLVYRAKESELVCRFDRLVYPIRENIPVLLETESREITAEDLEKIKQGD